MNNIIKLQKEKEQMIELYNKSIHEECMKMIEWVLNELKVEYKILCMNSVAVFRINDIEFTLSHFISENQIRFGVHNMIQRINILNHSIGESDRAGDGLEKEYLLRMVKTQLEKLGVEL